MDGLEVLFGLLLLLLFTATFTAVYWHWKYTNLMKWVREELPLLKKPKEEVFTEGFTAGRDYEKSVQERIAR